MNPSNERKDSIMKIFGTILIISLLVCTTAWHLMAQQPYTDEALMQEWFVQTLQEHGEIAIGDEPNPLIRSDGLGIEPETTDPENRWVPNTLRIYTTSPGRQWAPRTFRARPVLAGRQWAPRALRVRGAGVSSVRQPESPSLDDVDYCARQLLLLAKAGQWDTLGAEIERLGGNPGPITEQAPAAEKDVPSFNLAFGGVLKPTSDKKKLDRMLGRMEFLGLDCPIVPIECLEGNWKETFDAFFAAIDGRIKPPVIGLCIRKMGLHELLCLPEFLRRYQGRYHSIVANYDLTTRNFVRRPSPAGVMRGIHRVSLSLALIRRADPSTHVWLAVGYNSNPSWQSWIEAQSRAAHDGIALTGTSANLACMHPKVARMVVKNFAKQFKDTPLCLIGFTEPFLNPELRRNDDHAVERYQELRKALDSSGFVFTHIEEK